MHRAQSDDQIIAFVRHVFDQADLVSVQPFGGQHTNTCYDLEIVNPTMELALKVYADMPWQDPWREARLLRLLTSETGVPVPRVLYFDDTLPVPWILYTRLPGGPLSDVLETLDEWELETVGYEMGRYLAHIHSMPLDAFGELVTGNLDETQSFFSEQDFVLCRANQALDLCLENEHLTPQEADQIIDILAKSTLLDRGRACLVHGDYTKGNIIVDRSVTSYHVTGVLDLLHALAGSPEYDIAVLANGCFRDRPTLQKGVFDGYTDYTQIPADFWERVHLYQLLAALERIAELDRRSVEVEPDAVSQVRDIFTQLSRI